MTLITLMDLDAKERKKKSDLLKFKFLTVLNLHRFIIPHCNKYWKVMHRYYYIYALKVKCVYVV